MKITQEDIIKFIEKNDELNKFIHSFKGYNEINTNKLFKINLVKQGNYSDTTSVITKIKQFALNEKKQLNETINSFNNECKKLFINSKYAEEAKRIYRVINEYFNFVGSKNHKFFEYDIDLYKSKKEKPILYVRNLTKYYGHKKIPTIDSLNFDIYPGEFHAFIGANGAGKTTTIKSIISSYYKWSGTILIDGIPNINEASKKKIGYVPEKAVFPEGFSAQEYLTWMIMLSGFNKRFAINKVKQVLKDLGMWNLRHVSPNKFSSGQKRKIILAQTLTHDPEIIIMDEPMANLDPKARIDFFNTLKHLKQQGKAIFMSSHVLSELNSYCDSLTILDGGKVIYSGKRDELLKTMFANEYIVCIDNKFSSKFNEIINELKIIASHYASDHNLIYYKITFKNEEIYNKFQINLIKNNVYFNELRKNIPSLQDIYEQMVINGSKDTMSRHDIERLIKQFNNEC